ncbi:RNA/RNP complex-1-interacting phosphatase [Genypterus blacodes]|uniref:RNA/RNP complex-1-interacting phosphatase n=1 Tax=Genypterus blacodes TaxID=154954 RepID=UPI003F7657A8
MSAHRRRSSGIPDRWLNYSAVGKRLPGTRFIAFKVPLKQALSRQLPLTEAFGPWDLLDVLEEEEQQLGLMIDLTNTTRYYSLQDVPDSWLFLKIFTAGHQVPSDATILSFKRAVGSFLRDNAHNDKLIGVHCTHGLNRTGYMICRYLIDVDRMDPRDAVKLFNSSRGHVMERDNYLEDLQRGRRRSNHGMDQPEHEPESGQADRRPSFTSCDPREERRAHVTDSWEQRSSRCWRRSSRQAPPPLPPSPPHRWPRPRLEPRPRRPPLPQQARSRRAPPPPGPYAPQHASLPRYCPGAGWENQASGYSPPERRYSRDYY